MIVRTEAKLKYFFYVYHYVDVQTHTLHASMGLLWADLVVVVAQLNPVVLVLFAVSIYHQLNATISHFAPHADELYSTHGPPICCFDPSYIHTHYKG